MAVADNLYLDNDYYIEVGPLTYTDTADGTEKLRTGWTNLKAKICLTDAHDAAAVDAGLDVTLTEQGTTAVYRGGMDGALLSAHLDALVDQGVWLHVYRDQDYHITSPVTVRERQVA